ncbi:MAG: NAD(P)H-hydrate dehydratase [Planctomycetota bacterium]
MKIIKKLPIIKPRRPDTHKGDYGKILVIAGCRGMTGAAYLSAQGALRSGAGLVYLATPFSQQPILATKLTCVITYPLSETSQGTISINAIKEMDYLLNPVANGKYILTLTGIDATAIGPGISRHPQTIKFVQSVLPLFKCPIVIDADGLNALIDKPDILQKMRSIVLTPHSAEMARLLKTTPTKIQFNRKESAIETAKRFNAVVVLKGYQTIVTDGEDIYINNTGNPGMATAGSGDVLTGMIATFLSQKFSPFEAAQLAVYLHGLAGDLAVNILGESSLISTDILDFIPQAFKKLS